MLILLAEVEEMPKPAFDRLETLWFEYLHCLNNSKPDSYYCSSTTFGTYVLKASKSLIRIKLAHVSPSDVGLRLARV